MTEGDQAVGLEKGEPWAPCCCFVTLLSFISNLINLLNKNDLL